MGSIDLGDILFIEARLGVQDGSHDDLIDFQNTKIWAGGVAEEDQRQKAPEKTGPSQVFLVAERSFIMEESLLFMRLQKISLIKESMID